MWGLIISLGVLVVDWAYHNYLEDHPPPKHDNEIALPTNTDGAPYPLIYGRCRVRNPVIVWCDQALSQPHLVGSEVIDYLLSMHLVLGLGFLDGDQRIYNMWAGEAKLDQTNDIGNGSYGATLIHGLQDLVGDGNVEDALPSGRGEAIHYARDPSDNTSPWVVAGAVEFLNGNTSQKVVGDTFPYNPLTRLGEHMTETITVSGQPQNSLFGTIDPQRIASYRGALSVFLFGHFGALHWFVGNQSQVEAYSFEASSYPADSSYPSQTLYRIIGTDANPADVIYDLLTGKFGKLGIDPSMVDMPSFQLAAYTLWTEGHGYSRAIEDPTSGADIIQAILEQIAGQLYEEPTTGKFVLKLIRNDYDPRAVREINKTNCKDLQNLTCGSWVGLVNKLRVKFSDNTNDYRETSVTAQNLANAVGQDGIVREQVVEMPGITNAVTARNVAERELAIRSKPAMSCTALCDRSFQDARPGDVLKVTWSKPDVGGLMFRVVSVDLGTPSDPTVRLGLVQDPYYVWRLRPPVDTGFGGHTIDTDGLGLGGG